MSKLLRFTELPQSYPDTRAADERKQDFAEIYANYNPNAASEQASRCSQCGIPYCQVHCPLQNNIPDWLKLTAEGRLKEAYQLSSATNTFPEICGRICPQDRLCEGNCVIEHGFDSVTIGSVEKYLTENAFDEGWVETFAPSHENGMSVGIIGAGPGGLAAANILRQKGYAVHVYDRYDRVGGLLIYGIPNFKLEKEVVARRQQQYEQSGIIFHMNTDIGHDISFDDLRAKHDSVIITTGVYKAREAHIPGADLPGILPALDYLIASNKVGLGDEVKAFEQGALDARGKRVVVVGGGDTAMDCVRTAVRQGAKNVICLYRRDRENMPGSQREVANAEAEGVEFQWLSAPASYESNHKGIEEMQAEKIMGTRMRLGPADADGRRKPEPMPDSVFELKADMIIQALGFLPEDLPDAFGQPELKVTRWGTLKVDEHLMTNLPGVFAAGDIVRGASLVVWAIADGRRAAEHMHSYMQSHVRKAA